MSKKETKIQKAIMEHLEEQRIFFWRNNTMGTFDPFTGRFRKPGRFSMNGVSDIIGIYKGKFLAIEVKSEKGVLSKTQKVFIKKVLDEGGIAFMAKSVEDVINNLK